MMGGPRNGKRSALTRSMSALIFGEYDSVLVDAMMAVADAEALAK
jgi:hypothetical protein